jgi:hypothetical protein
MAGEDVDLPAYVACFRVAEKLGVDPMDVAPYLDAQADERAPVYWVQAAVNLMTAEVEYRKRQENDQMSDASKRRAKSRRGGTIGA